MNGALHELRFGIDDAATLEHLRESYASFVKSVVHEIDVLVRGGSFAHADELDEFIHDYVETLEHVFEPSKAKVFLSFTHNAEALFREIGPYSTASDAMFWYQMAFHAQVADLKDAMGLAGLYSWFRKPFHGEATRYDVDEEYVA